MHFSGCFLFPVLPLSCLPPLPANAYLRQPFLPSFLPSAVSLTTYTHSHLSRSPSTSVPPARLSSTSPPFMLHLSYQSFYLTPISRVTFLPSLLSLVLIPYPHLSASPPLLLLYVSFSTYPTFVLRYIPPTFFTFPSTYASSSFLQFHLLPISLPVFRLCFALNTFSFHFAQSHYSPLLYLSSVCMSPFSTHSTFLLCYLSSILLHYFPSISVSSFLSFIYIFCLCPLLSTYLPSLDLCFTLLIFHVYSLSFSSVLHLSTFPLSPLHPPYYSPHLSVI